MVLSHERGVDVAEGAAVGRGYKGTVIVVERIDNGRGAVETGSVR